MLAVVRAPGRRDALWAAEQVLRAGSCHALLGWFRRAGYDELRRLAVAAEGSRGLGRAVPPAAKPRANPRLPACASPWTRATRRRQHASVHILKRRGVPAGAPLRLP